MPFSDRPSIICIAQGDDSSAIQTAAAMSGQRIIAVASIMSSLAKCFRTLSPFRRLRGCFANQSSISRSLQSIELHCCSRVQHVPFVSCHPSQRGKLTVEHSPLQIIPTKISFSIFPFDPAGSLFGSGKNLLQPICSVPAEIFSSQI
jgi:hypothetical protein